MCGFSAVLLRRQALDLGLQGIGAPLEFLVVAGGGGGQLAVPLRGFRLETGLEGLEFRPPLKLLPFLKLLEPLGYRRFRETLRGEAAPFGFQLGRDTGFEFLGAGGQPGIEFPPQGFPLGAGPVVLGLQFPDRLLPLLYLLARFLPESGIEFSAASGAGIRGTRQPPFVQVVEPGYYERGGAHKDQGTGSDNGGEQGAARSRLGPCLPLADGTAAGTDEFLDFQEGFLLLVLQRGNGGSWND